MKQEQEVGAALRAALRGRGCALGPREARDLSVLLIGLINDGLIGPDTEAEAVHGPRVRSSVRAVVGCGGQPETAPAYNMGQSVCIPEDEA